MSHQSEVAIYNNINGPILTNSWFQLVIGIKGVSI